MKIVADTHTHTVVSHHAFSTVLEMVKAAKQQGHVAIAITDHGPKMIDGAHEWHFFGMLELPEIIDGIRLIRGVEANIIDMQGNIDMDSFMLKQLEWNIVSFHEPIIAPTNEDEHTAAWEAVVKHPFTDVLGHCGNPRFSFDCEHIVKLCAKYEKIIEINSNSIMFRKGSKERCAMIAKFCAKHGVSVVINSDAHFAMKVGVVDNAVNMLSDIKFPSELIINIEKNRFFDAIQHRIDMKRNTEI